jgi:hypothetical protein
MQGEGVRDDADVCIGVDVGIDVCSCGGGHCLSSRPIMALNAFVIYILAVLFSAHFYACIYYYHHCHIIVII